MKDIDLSLFKMIFTLQKLLCYWLLLSIIKKLNFNILKISVVTETNTFEIKHFVDF